jgi:hypothetical protein
MHDSIGNWFPGLSDGTIARVLRQIITGTGVAFIGVGSPFQIYFCHKALVYTTN